MNTSERLLWAFRWGVCVCSGGVGGLKKLLGQNGSWGISDDYPTHTTPWGYGVSYPLTHPYMMT